MSSSFFEFVFLRKVGKDKQQELGLQDNPFGNKIETVQSSGHRGSPPLPSSPGPDPYISISFLSGGLQSPDLGHGHWGAGAPN